MAKLSEIQKNQQSASFSQVESGVKAMKEEMEGIAKQGMPNGAAAALVSRALKNFEAESLAFAQTQEPNATIAKTWMNAYRKLHSSFQHAGARVEDQKDQRRSVALMERVSEMRSNMAREARRLGQYQSLFQRTHAKRRLYSSGFKAVQQEFVDDRAESLFIELEKIYWSARSAMDKYLDSQQEQQEATRRSADIFENYLTCRVDFPTLAQEYKFFEEQFFRGQAILKETWQAMEHQTGLLAATVADGNIYPRFALHDTAYVDREAIKKELQNFTGCPLDHPEAEQLVLEKLHDTLQNGYFGQTVDQVIVMMHLTSQMHGKFEGLGLESPKLDSLEESAQRFKSALKRFDEHRAYDRLATLLRTELSGCAVKMDQMASHTEKAKMKSMAGGALLDNLVLVVALSIYALQL